MRYLVREIPHAFYCGTGVFYLHRTFTSAMLRQNEKEDTAGGN